MTNEELKDKIEAVAPLLIEIADALYEKALGEGTPRLKAAHIYAAYQKAVEARKELMSVDLHDLD